MVEWIYVNTPKISRIAYNAEVSTMYIDFPGSTLDIPYKGVTEAVFREFSQAENVDAYYDLHIKDVYPQIERDIENKIDCKL